MEKKYSVTIYALTLDDAVVYVGSTKRNPAIRFSRHHSEAKSGSKIKLHTWIRENNPVLRLKYLEVCNSEERYRRESHYITFYDTKNNGYNEDLSNRLGRPEGCINPSGADHYLHGKSVPRHVVDASVAARLGKPLSEKHKEKLRTKQIGRADQSTKIQCTETGVVYPSIAQAAKLNGISATSLLRHINGRNESCGGLTFCRQGSEPIKFVPKVRKQRGPLAAEQIENIRRASLKRGDHCISIRCIDTGEEFKSISDASRSKGVSITALRRNLSGGSKTCGGLRFERV